MSVVDFEQYRKTGNKEYHPTPFECEVENLCREIDTCLLPANSLDQPLALRRLSRPQWLGSRSNPGIIQAEYSRKSVYFSPRLNLGPDIAKADFSKLLLDPDYASQVVGHQVQRFCQTLDVVYYDFPGLMAPMVEIEPFCIDHNDLPMFLGTLPEFHLKYFQRDLFADLSPPYYEDCITLRDIRAAIDYRRWFSQEDGSQIIQLIRLLLIALQQGNNYQDLLDSLLGGNREEAKRSTFSPVLSPAHI